MARKSQPPLALFRVVIDHGLNTEILYRRARSAGDSIDRVLPELERDGVPYRAVSGMILQNYDEMLARPHYSHSPLASTRAGQEHPIQ